MENNTKNTKEQKNPKKNQFHRNTFVLTKINLSDYDDTNKMGLKIFNVFHLQFFKFEQRKRVDQINGRRG